MATFADVIGFSDRQRHHMSRAVLGWAAGCMVAGEQADGWAAKPNSSWKLMYGHIESATVTSKNRVPPDAGWPTLC